MINRKHFTILFFVLLVSSIASAQADTTDVFYPEKEILSSSSSFTTGMNDTFHKEYRINDDRTIKESKIYINNLDGGKATLRTIVMDNSSFDYNEVNLNKDSTFENSTSIKINSSGWKSIDISNKEFNKGDLIVQAFRINNGNFTAQETDYRGNIERNGIEKTNAYAYTNNEYQKLQNFDLTFYSGFEIEKDTPFRDIITFIIGGGLIIGLLSKLRGVKRE